MDSGDHAKAELSVGDEIQVRARVQLGDLGPAAVSVQLFFGLLSSDGEFVSAQAATMHRTESDNEGNHTFESRGVRCKRSGLHGYTFRVLPNHPDLATPFMPGLLTWAAEGESS